MKAILLSITLLLSLSSRAERVAGIPIPRTRGDLHLQGAGLLRKGLFFKIYVGALYLHNTNHVGNILSDVPKRIDIHYFHRTPKKHMIRIANDSLKENLPEAQYMEMLPKIQQLHNAYLNGEKGSFASLVHTPGKGLTYTFDNTPVINIGCDDFANAYLTIWLGEKPSSPSVKKAMLNDD